MEAKNAAAEVEAEVEVEKKKKVEVKGRNYARRDEQQGAAETAVVALVEPKISAKAEPREEVKVQPQVKAIEEKKAEPPIQPKMEVKVVPKVEPKPITKEISQEKPIAKQEEPQKLALHFSMQLEPWPPKAATANTKE